MPDAETCEVLPLSIMHLLHGGKHYLIPMYQRNYSWEEGEITQLIQDIIDYQPRNESYYIGSLVVFEGKRDGQPVYEIIDGQQRLTTLALLTSFIKKWMATDSPWQQEMKLEFECRESSRRTLDAIFEVELDTDPAQVLNGVKPNASLLNGYRIIRNHLSNMLEASQCSPKAFATYLANNVILMRVLVPHDTDLNHYFEIMNNRGEQLEEHEVLKARLMDRLGEGATEDSKRDRNCLHRVWEACANMERYVQMGFVPEQRHRIFGDNDWGRLDVDSFESLSNALDSAEKTVSGQGNGKTIAQILQEKVTPNILSKDNEAPERFNTVINFPNFLLQVLRVDTGKDVSLDDKNLLSAFQKFLLDDEEAIGNIKRFTLSLIKCKYLMDQYVIKREYIGESDKWSLQRIKWNEGSTKNSLGRASYVNTFGSEEVDEEENRSILMLLSAFHVSTPTMAYKYWLNAALAYLYKTEKVMAGDYLRHLESVGRAFVFDRFLNPRSETGYYAIIKQNDGICQTTLNDITDQEIDGLLTYGNIRNNFVFNYLDYLLWKQYKREDETIQKYNFTFRSSVEHYYPRNPLKDIPRLNDDILDSFGNLCLISHSKNSTLGNLTPRAKRDYYQKTNTIDSVKQHLMMKLMDEDCDWDEPQIGKHHQEMKAVLMQALTQAK